jgi:nicotinate-nucleotide--dimethylbenzimidazole phosphoribosyltransferase
MVTPRSLVAPSSNPALEKALRDKLARRNELGGSLGELEPLAVRLGLMMGTLKPRLVEPQLLVFAADHGLAVDGIAPPRGQATHETVRRLLANQLPLTVFARAQQIGLTVVDCGVAEPLPGHERLLVRKIAHGTRNARVTQAMSVEQVHAGMRAGMQIGETLRGNVTMLAGLGVGAHESASLLISRLAGTPIRDLLIEGDDMDSDRLGHLMVICQGAAGRHRDVTEPIEVLAAMGGFEVAVMVGVMLMAASKRHLLLVDGMAACAALLVAARIAQPVTDYSMFCRSNAHLGLDQALTLFRAAALLELGLDATDGTGATLAWPLLRSAAALLTEVADGEDPGPSRPGELGAPESVRAAEAETPFAATRPSGDIGDPGDHGDIEVVEPAPSPADVIFGKALY